MALRNERLVAFIHFRMTRKPTADGVKAGEVWGQGVGRTLWNAGLTELRNKGFEAAVIWVLEKNSRGRTFYESTGCELDGEQKKNLPLAPMWCPFAIELPSCRHRRKRDTSPELAPSPAGIPGRTRPCVAQVVDRSYGRIHS